MKRISIFLILILTISVFSSVEAQQISFAKSYTTNGHAIGASETWTIPASGKSIFILFNSEGKKIKDNMVYLYIDKFDGETYQPMESQTVFLADKRNWFVFRQKFVEEGEYKVFVQDKNNNTLASSVLNINMKEAPIKYVQKDSAPYYQKAKITFSEWIISGKPFRTLKTKKMSKQPDSVCVYINQPDSLNTNMIYADFYKSDESTKNWNLLETKKYSLLPKWDYTFFKYFFPKIGYYRIDLYNEDHDFITSGYLKVEE